MPVISYDLYMKRLGLDGYVSIVVPPTIAHDTKLRLKTRRYYQNWPGKCDDQNPRHEGGLAVEQVISEGINVNVTLLFSVESYSETALYSGLGKAGRVR